MKTKKIFLSVLAICFISLSSFANNEDNGKKNPSETNQVTMSIAELKARYATIVFDGDLSTLSQVTMLESASPCNGLQSCGAASAQARHEAQQLANDCCCVVTYGYECCDPDTGSQIAVLFITMPKGNCVN
ncbi:MAG: hypothetical protein QE487_05480 [Fluviicola sp.]|nr:hypothetical protein [Fluviicola sp.]